MKKIIISLLLTATPVMLFAQLKVFSDGKISIKRSTKNPYAYLAVENIETSYNNPYNMAIKSEIEFKTNEANMGIMSKSFINSPTSSGRNFGVFGTAGNATSGYNYGVYGQLRGTNNGAAIAGSTSDNIGFYISGKYAGYFDGPTVFNGTMTATSYVTSSDMRLKENVELLSENEDGSTTLGNVLNMNVLKYNFKERHDIPEAERDTIQAIEVSEVTNPEKHFGLSAQELQTIYPDLVYEGQDGYLGIKYMELVPILIRSIQELKQELDEVKGINADDKSQSRSIANGVNTAIATGYVLYQNTPNPFKEKTVIRFRLADDAQNAAICIYDLTGKQLKKLPISSGETSVSVNGWELGEGMFLYTLLVNGQEIDTKRMIITK